MNYFSYFTEIEDTFIRRRGKHLMLSPIDWALIESWKERGVPLHVALRGIEHAFDSHESKKRKRSVKSLLYCQEEVEAQYAEWLESRVGGHDEKPTGEAGLSPDASPFSREVVVAHLARSLDSLSQLGQDREEEDDLKEALVRASSLLTEIRDDYVSAAQPDTRKLEDSLTGLDRLLDSAINAAIPPDQLESSVTAVEEQIKPYKRHMDKAAYQQTRDNLLRRRLREHFGIPRLSLFYL
ncbi:MAG TPA: hypothetical protein VJT71_12735 [Pyrinomonadaceae bacterium]|nr:hypothetical protein [Pyrinomonadaceae bacterium]